VTDHTRTDPAIPEVAGYEVVRELGHGGMGVVYLARQRSLNRFVALKLLRTPLATPEERARFRSEAESVARLQHSNIVQVFEVGECQAGGSAVPFFSLEFISGGSLDRLTRGVPQPPDEAARVLAVLADAVQHAHDRGIVHRDIKPANVLLLFPTGATGESLSAGVVPKLTDFGLAREFDGTDTASGVVRGTPSYMAPEQAEGRCSPASDVYGLGAVLYELLTGRPPFRGVTLLDTLEQVRSADPVRPTALQPTVPAELENICLMGLRKDPRERYARPADLAADLRRLLGHERVLARPPRRPGRFRGVRLAGVVVLAVAGGVLAGRSWPPPVPTPAPVVGRGVAEVEALLAATRGRVAALHEAVEARRRKGDVAAARLPDLKSRAGLLEDYARGLAHRYQIAPSTVKEDEVTAATTAAHAAADEYAVANAEVLALRARTPLAELRQAEAEELELARELNDARAAAGLPSEPRGPLREAAARAAVAAAEARLELARAAAAFHPERVAAAESQVAGLARQVELTKTNLGLVQQAVKAGGRAKIDLNSAEAAVLEVTARHRERKDALEQLRAEDPRAAIVRAEGELEAARRRRAGVAAE
jgi:hypothetical protein